jgi:hypothetical protein
MYTHSSDYIFTNSAKIILINPEIDRKSTPATFNSFENQEPLESKNNSNTSETNYLQKRKYSKFSNISNVQMVKNIDEVNNSKRHYIDISAGFDSPGFSSFNDTI